ncbi:ABC transporter substrate-binding protein [Bordetella sp. N]|nr:ABC transporter substrate-binding protein [Bordetella sp. N]
MAAALTLGLLAAGVGTATLAQAADWPSRTIKVVAPSAAGGGADLIARLVARILEDKLKQGTIVENRAGAGGILGTAYVRNAAPDGYTFLVSTSSTHSANQYLYKELPYDAVKDFEQISLIGTFGSVALVAPNSPFKTLPDLTAYASAHPDKVFFGYYSSSSQVPPELLKAQARLPINGVAYKNVTQIITDLIGGQIDFAFVDYLTAMGPLKGGQLRPLAVTGTERQSAWPDVPTMSTYLPGFSVVGWYGLSAPAGTPKDIIEKVQAALESELNKPDVKARFEGYGVSIKTMDHAQFTQFVKDDRRNWAEWVKVAKIQPQ